jgi:hypothetical protein
LSGEAVRFLPYCFINFSSTAHALGKLIPVGYGIQKLQIICVVEDDKVSVDDLIETITEQFADHVSFNVSFKFRSIIKPLRIS